MASVSANCCNNDCGKELVQPLRCSRCKEATYCDVSCQRAHWKTGHKDECQPGDAVSAAAAGENVVNVHSRYGKSEVPLLMRQLLGIPEDDSIEYDNELSDDGDREHPAMHAIVAISKLIRNAEKHGQAIDDYFHHEHHLRSTDGCGAYVLISLFTMISGPPGGPKLSAIATTVIRCHDNLRETMLLPSQDVHSAKFFSEFVESQKESIGCSFRRVPYKLCTKLITDCLLRMKECKKVIQDKEARTVVALYGLSTKDPLHQVNTVRHQLPVPSPAPNVASLWLTLNRPEYFSWTMNEDLFEMFGEAASKEAITVESMKHAMRRISRDRYMRERMYSMLEFTALWHVLGDETEVASWMLWERNAMKNYSDVKSAIDAMENNVIFQLMINKFFQNGCRLRLIPKFSDDQAYGQGMANFYYYREDLNERGTLPPHFIITASVAAEVGTSGKTNEGSNQTLADAEGILNLSKDLRVKRSGCAICGKTSFTGGGILKECGKCKSVVYCCREHQLLHWKKGGHKQECAQSIIE